MRPVLEMEGKSESGYAINSLESLVIYLFASPLQPLPTELQLDKPAQSVFIGTDLEAMLHERGITHLLFTGVTTECCVLGSYRQASDLGFYSLLLEDCCAAYDPQEHEAAIAVLLAENGAIGWVTTADQLLTVEQV